MRVPPAQSCDRVGDAGQRAVTVAVLQLAGDPGQARAEDERLGAHASTTAESACTKRSSSRDVALHRARDVAEHDDRPRPPVGRRQTHSAKSPPVARLRRNIDPRREHAAVVVELVAARPAQLEARHEQVDEALGVAQLGGGHPVELAVAERLGDREGVGCDDDLVRLGVLGSPSSPAAASGRARGLALVASRPRAPRASAAVVAGPPAPGPRAVGSAGPSLGMRDARWRHQTRRRSGRSGARSSRRRTKTASPAARTCSRSPMSTRVSARAKSMRGAQVDGSPADRRARPKPTASPQQAPAVDLPAVGHRPRWRAAGHARRRAASRAACAP